MKSWRYNPETTTMTKHDQELVDWAENLHYTEWPEINENAAETEEGKLHLHNIAVRLYHYEEASCGML